eukprot:CAMPEP_0173184890 /NCGR_PEP_ID=MMETSP1141-20130122/9232_1 /TAXON_ID=483371 /ORGANISM="non described non described, Strain CCMP2298" /LENGTH=626 /DNA_ID=CAMNT_0014108321 /DNA_START=79 /DNA_END=1956 /DNA_ORIENTATION=-
MSLIKVDKATFPAGTFSLYVKSAPHEREVEGKVVLHLSYPSFVKGVWIKLQGTASSFSPECGMVKADLLRGEEEHHEDGLHQVFLGFGQGDESHGSVLELAPGRHHWPFHFKLPSAAPASYFDGRHTISYELVATVDSPNVFPSTLHIRSVWRVLNCSHLQVVRAREEQVEGNRRLLRSNTALQSDKGVGFLPSMLHILRSPTRLTLRGLHSPHTHSSSPFESKGYAMFPFATAQHQYPVLCTLSPPRQVVLRAELISEICFRNHPKLPFVSKLTGRGEKAPKVSECSTGSTEYVLWRGSNVSADGQSVLSVPLNIATDARERAILAKPSPHPLNPHHGKILHYTSEGPLFRHRLLLRVTAVRGGGGEELCVVVGEVVVLPPHPKMEALPVHVSSAPHTSTSTSAPPASTSTSAPSTSASAPTSTSTSQEVPSARADIHRSLSNGSIATPARRRTREASASLDMHLAPIATTAATTNTAATTVNTTTAPISGSASASAPSVVLPFSQFTAAHAAHAAHAPSRPNSAQPSASSSARRPLRTNAFPDSESAFAVAVAGFTPSTGITTVGVTASTVGVAVGATVGVTSATATATVTAGNLPGYRNHGGLASFRAQFPTGQARSRAQGTR